MRWWLDYFSQHCPKLKEMRIQKYIIYYDSNVSPYFLLPSVCYVLYVQFVIWIHYTFKNVYEIETVLLVRYIVDIFVVFVYSHHTKYVVVLHSRHTTSFRNKIPGPLPVFAQLYYIRKVSFTLTTKLLLVISHKCFKTRTENKSTVTLYFELISINPMLNIIRIRVENNFGPDEKWT